MTTEPAKKGYTGHPAGDSFDEAEPGQRGHFQDVATPNTCLCCGVLYYYQTGPLCICAQNGNYWLQDELRRTSCFFHVQEKIKDNLFGALSGEFVTPGGNPTYKRPDERATTPIVHK